MIKEFRRFDAWVNDKKAELGTSFQGVIVACSGGPDSTALFHLFWRNSKAGENFPIALAHVAYGLRGAESEADFAFVEALAAAHGAPFFSHRVEGVRPETGVQAWARGVRRTFFEGLAADGWLIALAHHLDDVAETALFRLARGTSVENAAGMRVWDPPYWRPLLEERKDDLLAFLAAENLAFRVDASNARADYARNVIRQRVLPELEALFPGAAGRLARSLLDAQAPEPRSVAMLKAQLPRGAQLSRRVLGTLPGGTLVVAPPATVPKAPRESQHRLSLSAVDVSALLEPGAAATVKGVNFSGPGCFRAHTVGARDLRFVPASQRSNFVALERDGERVGLIERAP